MIGSGRAMVGVVLSVVIGIGVAGCGGSSATPAITNTVPGGIIFSPSTWKCSDPVAVSVTFSAPASVKRGDMVAIVGYGGKSQASFSPFDPDTGWAQQADGSWAYTLTIPASTIQPVCGKDASSYVGGIDLSLGAHTVQVLDAKHTVLSQGFYTVQP